MNSVHNSAENKTERSQQFSEEYVISQENTDFALEVQFTRHERYSPPRKQLYYLVFD